MSRSNLGEQTGFKTVTKKTVFIKFKKKNHKYRKLKAFKECNKFSNVDRISTKNSHSPVTSLLPMIYKKNKKCLTI